MDIIFILKAILIAIVEGLTEFIPVSSTGHMILVGWAIGFKGEFAKMFEVVIQLGAIMAVVVLYWKKIEESIIEFFRYIFTRGKEGKTGFRFGINVIVAFLVALIGMKKFVDYLKKKPLKVFAIYRVAAGILLGVLVLSKVISLT